jgi:hypothetical protein
MRNPLAGAKQKMRPYDENTRQTPLPAAYASMANGLTMQFIKKYSGH